MKELWIVVGVVVCLVAEAQLTSEMHSGWIDKGDFLVDTVMCALQPAAWGVWLAARSDKK